MTSKIHQITKPSSGHESKESKHHVCMERQKMKVSPFYLNLRYTYQTVSGDVQTTCSQWSADLCQRRCWAGCDFEMSQDQAEKWVKSRKRSPLPYIFVVPPNKDRSYWRSMTWMRDPRFLVSRVKVSLVTQWQFSSTGVNGQAWFEKCGRKQKKSRGIILSNRYLAFSPWL